MKHFWSNHDNNPTPICCICRSNAVFSQMIINNTWLKLHSDVPQPQRKVLRWPWISRSKCYAALICLKGWNTLSFLHLFDWIVNGGMLLFWHIRMSCVHRKGGVEQAMLLRGKHYSANSSSTNLCITTPLHYSSARFLQTLSNLLPIWLWPFSKGQQSTKHALSGLLLMWPLKKNELLFYLMVAYRACTNLQRR